MQVKYSIDRIRLAEFLGPRPKGHESNLPMQDVAFDDHMQLHKLVVAVYQIQVLQGIKKKIRSTNTRRSVASFCWARPRSMLSPGKPYFSTSTAVVLFTLCRAPLSGLGTRLCNLLVPGFDCLSSRVEGGNGAGSFEVDAEVVAVTATAPIAKPAANTPACSARDIVFSCPSSRCAVCWSTCKK